eukprot:TRINITY_DN14116_c0_g1_i1.p1 TRINITY_DN14116_c0_g1~~TRINITY_DN14116_c0_g1_i1.p1  ORF type:complete len:103 (+),score=12.92 TRINITY_DN14116_c0_g1_i1:305-613(+)
MEMDTMSLEIVPKKAKYYACKTDDDVVHLFEYEGNGGHWAISVSRLINQFSPKMSGLGYGNKQSLSNEVQDLSDKLMTANEENEELLESNKEFKHKNQVIKE